MIIQKQKQILNIMASTNANWFIYYFKCIPLIGKVLPDSIYGNIPLKKKAAIVALILRIFGKLIGKAIFVCLLTVLPVFLVNPSMRFNSYTHVFFIINFIGSFLSSSIFNADRNKYICIRLMRMDAKSYTVSTVLFQVFTDFFYLLPVVTLSTLLIGGSLTQGLLLTFSSTAFNLIGEAFFLLIYTGSGIMLSKKVSFLILVAVFTLAGAYIPIYLHSPLLFDKLPYNLLYILVMLLLGALSTYVILKSEKYHEIAARTIKASEFTIDKNQVMAEARFADVAMREKDFSDSELKSNKFDNKSGFTYLNAIFFERHKRLLIKPILIRLAIIAVLFIAAIITSIFLPEFIRPLNNSGAILPVFVFIMYFASIGERVCKAMFYNCDVSLLRYSFYRDKKAIISNFKVRLFRVAGLNLIVATAISAAVVGLALIFNLNWSAIDIASFVLSILFLSLFFSVHHLFLYYVFQPYTAEEGLKNPFYSIINWGVYFLCYFSMKIKSPPSYFTLIVLGSTIIYIVAALILVYKYAPKNFRVK